MRDSNYFTPLLLAAACLALLSFGGTNTALGLDINDAFQACRTPSVAGTSTKPNVLLVMDYSGSMQFAAYYTANRTSTVSSGSYNDYGSDSYSYIRSATYKATETYYGLYKSDTYYTYDKPHNFWEPATTQPVTSYTITGSAGDGMTPRRSTWFTAPGHTFKSYGTTAVSAAGANSTSIWFTVDAHTFVPGDEVTFTGLTSHSTMNNLPFRIVETDATRVRVEFPWNGTADAVGARVATIVAFSGLNSHEALNGQAHVVQEVQGDRFKIAFPFNGRSDDATTCRVQQRIMGSLLPPAWRPGAQYVIGQIVSVSNACYRCTSNNTATFDTQPGIGVSWATAWSAAACSTYPVGVSGNILNYFLTCRIDAALKAVIGGQISTGDADAIPCMKDCNPENCDRTTCTDAQCAALKTAVDNKNTYYYYTKGQGLRRYVRDDAAVLSDWYVRMHDSLTNTGTAPTWPDNYASPTDSFMDKTTWFTISGRYKGELRAQGAPITTGSPKIDTKYFDQWRFTVTESTKLVVMMYPLWSSGNARVALYSAALTNNQSETTNRLTTVDGKPAKFTYDLSPGTYYIRATSYDNNKTGNYFLAANVPMTPYRTLNTGTDYFWNNMRDGSRVSTLPAAQMRVKVPAIERQGVVQKAFTSVRFGFEYYNSGRAGKILVGCTNTSLCTLLDAFNTNNASDRTFPRNSTPSGEALEEAQKYFKQSSSTLNGSVIGIGTVKDPMYEATYDTGGGVTAVFPVNCRKSFALLVSDGAWNGSVDPAYPAWQMRSVDQRTDGDMSGDQNIKSFAVYAFGDELDGKRSQRSVAMYGGFKYCAEATGCEVAGCGPLNMPYPTTTAPTRTGNLSLSQFSDAETPPTWASGTSYVRNKVVQTGGVAYQALADHTASATNKPGSGAQWQDNWMITDMYEHYFIPGCNPFSTSTPYNDCCQQEWDQKWDEEVSGDAKNKGVPDGFFDASDGAKLEKALLTVIQEAVSTNASAGAVATTTQKSGAEGSDIIVRGLCEAAMPGSVDTYLWYGHMEAFWQYRDPVDQVLKYDFEKDPDLACYQRENLGLDMHCWDGGSLLRKRNKDNRIIFTVAYDDVTKTWKKIYLPTRAELPDAADSLFYHDDTDDTKDILTKEQQWNKMLSLGGPLDPAVGDLIDWIRGHQVPTLRRRTMSSTDVEEWVLGDVIYSTPVLVGRPAVGGISTRDPRRDMYYAYRNLDQSPDMQVLHRHNIAYVGANDGMLHAFMVRKWDPYLGTDGGWIDDPTGTDIGQELWAYIPSNLVSELKYLAEKGPTYGGEGGCVHRSMVDLAPSSFEVFIKSGTCPDEVDPPGVTALGRCWRTVLVGGERGGGDVYFALDVSIAPNESLVSEVDPKVNFLWEYSVLKNRVMFDRSTNDLVQCNTGPTDARCMPTSFTNVYHWLINPSVVPTPGAGETWEQKAYQLRDTLYEQLKVLPMSYTKPSVSQLEFPATLDVPTGMPDPAGELLTTVELFNFDDNRRRHIAFVGGGVRIFRDDCRVARQNTVSAVHLVGADRRYDLFRPDLLAIDMETGTNLFKYIWPSLDRLVGPSNTKYYTYFPVSKTGSNYIPYAMAEVLALDIWRYQRDDDGNITGLGEIGDDGLADFLYVGDMTGRLYGVKLNFAVQPYGMKLDLWKMKSQTGVTNNFRTALQPISVPPAASFERGLDPANPAGTNIYVIFGTGKYEDTDTRLSGGANDRSDVTRMSLYNLKELVELPTFSGGDITVPGGLKLRFDPKCWTGTFSDTCTWRNSAGLPDNCGNTCWNCVWHFKEPTNASGNPITTEPGERVISKVLIHDGIVWVTTFAPSEDLCNVKGTGWAYVLKYDCGIFDNYVSNPLGQGAATWPAVDTFLNPAGAGYTGFRVPLGPGMPSEPVLDSQGKNVIIQAGDGKIKKFAIKNPTKAKAWRER